MTDAVSAAVAQAFRDEWGQLVATLIAGTGDWDLAEESAQDAFSTALRTWPRDGVPANPGAWLTTTARRRAIDRLRRDAVGAEKLRQLASVSGSDGRTVPDHRLRLIFTCCHPVLSPEARVALTLRTLTGLSTGQIAHAFRVTESTMAKRLTRAKRAIKDAGARYRIPSDDELPDRLPAVLAVLYLLFNEGYSSTVGESAIRVDLCDEAIRSARLLPAEPEVDGLLALMLLHHSRADARIDHNGDLVTLERQDRGRWDRDAIAEAVRLLERALVAGRAGPYQIQAAIAACHATAPTAADTDWRQIAALYKELRRHQPSGIVALNEAVAVGMAYGPHAGLTRLKPLRDNPELAGYHLLPAARADLLRRAGRIDAAVAEYHHARDLTGNPAERRYLDGRITELTQISVAPLS